MGSLSEMILLPGLGAVASVRPRKLSGPPKHNLCDVPLEGLPVPGLFPSQDDAVDVELRASAVPAHKPRGPWRMIAEKVQFGVAKHKATISGG